MHLWSYSLREGFTNKFISFLFLYKLWVSGFQITLQIISFVQQFDPVLPNFVLFPYVWRHSGGRKLDHTNSSCSPVENSKVVFQCFLDLGEFFNCCVSQLTLIMPFRIITAIEKCSTYTYTCHINN
jgi:hypothetical protein